MTDEPPHNPPANPAPESEAPNTDASPAVPEFFKPLARFAARNKKRSAKELQATRNLWIVIGGLAFLLIISMLMRPSAPPSTAAPASVSESDVAAIRAEIEMRRHEVNRHRAAEGKPPLPSRAEGTEEITARLRQDADTLVALIERYQELNAEKDREITEKNIAIIRSEQRREALAAELGEARARPREAAGAAAQLQAELTEALERSNRLAEELTAARQRIAKLEDNPPTDEVDILHRRLDEAKRARDFFEQRAIQLEARFENGGNDDGQADGGP